MLNGKKLLLTLLETGGTLRARFVLLKGHTVQAEGLCALSDLPADGVWRIAFLGRSAYFESLEVAPTSRRVLLVKARREVEAALASREPFRFRCSARRLESGRQRLDLLAVPEADCVAASAKFPQQDLVCERFALVESSIAALVAQATQDAASVLWLRGADLVGLLVENGAVLSRELEHAPADGGEEALFERLERMRGWLQARARRILPDREIVLHLALGELAGKPNARGEGPVAPFDFVSSMFELRLAEAFSGVQPLAVLQWPEVFGLLTLDSDYSLLDSGDRARTWAEGFALGLGVALFLSGLVAGIAALKRFLV